MIINPFHRWYRWDYNCNLISLSNEELENEYENHILEILDVLFTYIDNEGIENAINDLYLSEDVEKIFDKFKINNIGQTGSVFTLGQYNK